MCRSIQLLARGEEILQSQAVREVSESLLRVTVVAAELQDRLEMHLRLIPLLLVDERFTQFEMGLAKSILAFRIARHQVQQIRIDFDGPPIVARHQICLSQITQVLYLLGVGEEQLAVYSLYLRR